MLYTEKNVLSALEDGILYLEQGDRLTPAAQDLLRQRGIPFRREKPEHMTHLNSRELVSKTHPRIAYRGKLDTLEAEILLCLKEEAMPRQTLEEMLDFCRSLMRADVLAEPVEERKLHGLTEAQLRHRSHDPKRYYGTDHILPEASDSLCLLKLNRLRALIRETELLSYHAFPKRTDLHRALNRLSSLCWILCLEERTFYNKGGSTWTSSLKN
jgi:ethanolamine utilization cobalamin adenosyltransferase